jgi:hypothetical protein
MVVQVRAEGKLDGAVVVARSLTVNPAPSERPVEAVMVQANRQFVPYILPVPMNVPVSFPNQDNTAHHVYSFSPVGSFELPLYKGDAPAPIVFTKPGVVPLGCNIHDWMIGYLFVVESPWYMQLENNTGAFTDLPPGQYEFTLWHPALGDQTQPSWPVTVTPGDQTVVLEVNGNLAELSQPNPPTARFDEQWDY